MSPQESSPLDETDPAIISFNIPGFGDVYKTVLMDSDYESFALLYMCNDDAASVMTDTYQDPNVVVLGTTEKPKGKAKKAVNKAWKACFGRFRGIEKIKFLFKVEQKEKLSKKKKEAVDETTEETL